jgi:hypothetical protein
MVFEQGNEHRQVGAGARTARTTLGFCSTPLDSSSSPSPRYSAAATRRSRLDAGSAHRRFPAQNIRSHAAPTASYEPTSTRRSAGLCAAAAGGLVTHCDRLSRQDLRAVASPLAPATARLAYWLGSSRAGGALAAHLIGSCEYVRLAVPTPILCWPRHSVSRSRMPRRNCEDTRARNSPIRGGRAGRSRQKRSRRYRSTNRHSWMATAISSPSPPG